MDNRRSYQGMGLKYEDARKKAVEYFERHPDRTILVGPVSLWLACPTWGLNETAKLLEDLLKDGIIRYASRVELPHSAVGAAYVLASGVSTRGGHSR